MMATGGETRLQYINGRLTFTVIMGEVKRPSGFGEIDLFKPGPNWWDDSADLSAVCRAVARQKPGGQNEDR